VLAGACELLADRGRLSVWLVGEPLRAVDRVRVISMMMPEPLARLTKAAAQDKPTDLGPKPLLSYPSPLGAPRADSEAEQALERALAPHLWAAGREWNRRYQASELAREYRLDLCWPVDRIVVEVDGADHRRRLKWADDRTRDVHLQMNGYAVLRFANEDVLADVQLVVHQVHRVLSRRRQGAHIPEMRSHVD
jgi:very-short-patch-repair endonuclease